MKISLTGKELHKGFGVIAGAVPRITTMNILQNAKLEVKNNKAELTATNLSTSVKYQLEITSCDGEGVVALPAIRVSKIANELTDSDDITLSTNGPKCTLKSSKGSFTFLSENPDRFPQISGVKTKSYVETDSDTLGSMLHKVGHAALREVKEVNLNGILIKIHNDDITMVTASTARLSMIKRKIVNPDNISVQAIMPVGQLSTLKNFLAEYKNESTPIKIAIDNSRACFWNEKGKFMYQLIEGNFINYEDIFQIPHDKKIAINRDELFSLVKTASYMTNEMNNYIKLSFTDKKLTISTINNLGDAELTATTTFDIPNTDLYFNPQYVLDALSVADDEITIEFTDNNKPILFKTGFEHQEIVLTMNPPGDNAQDTSNTKEEVYATQEA